MRWQQTRWWVLPVVAWLMFGVGMRIYGQVISGCGSPADQAVCLGSG